MKVLQTRRWGKGNRRPETVVRGNRFGSVAPSWFYLLIKHFVQRKESAMWRGTAGATFLARLFHTLAAIVECSRFTPGTDILAKDLAQLVWSFRNADVSDVRVSVLFALATSFHFLDDATLVGMILDDSIAGVGPFLSNAAACDPDENCRTIASLLVCKTRGAIQQIQASSSSPALTEVSRRRYWCKQNHESKCNLLNFC